MKRLLVAIAIVVIAGFSGCCGCGTGLFGGPAYSAPVYQSYAPAGACVPCN